MKKEKSKKQIQRRVIKITNILNINQILAKRELTNLITKVIKNPIIAIIDIVILKKDTGLRQN